jgi:hypothetical protein
MKGTSFSILPTCKLTLPGLIGINWQAIGTIQESMAIPNAYYTMQPCTVQWRDVTGISQEIQLCCVRPTDGIGV